MQLCPCPFLYTPIVIDYSNQAYANNGQEKYAKYQPDIYVSTRDISRQKTNVTMARNSKFWIAKINTVFMLI